MVFHDQGRRQVSDSSQRVQAPNAKSPNSWCGSSFSCSPQNCAYRGWPQPRVVKCVPISDSDLGVCLFQKALSSFLLNLGLQVQKTNGRQKAYILFKHACSSCRFHKGQKQSRRGLKKPLPTRVVLGVPEF